MASSYLCPGGTYHLLGALLERGLMELHGVEVIRCYYYQCYLTEAACRKRKVLAAELHDNKNRVVGFESGSNLYEGMKACVEACRKHPDIQVKKEEVFHCPECEGEFKAKEFNRKRKLCRKCAEKTSRRSRTGKRGLR